MNAIMKNVLRPLGAVVSALPFLASAAAEQRPIEEFIAAQSVTPSVITGWLDTTNKGLSFDAFGKANERLSLGIAPQMDGRVTVRTLADGTAHVSVVLHTSDAACWGSVGSGATDNAFGARPANIAAGRPAALGSGITRIDFAMPSPDLPLPSLFVVGGPGYEVDTFSTAISCEGALHAASGYPEGTHGMARTTQTGIFHTGVPTGCPPEREGNCFPTEFIEFRAVGP